MDLNNEPLKIAEERFSRRDFLRTTAAGAALINAGGLASACASSPASTSANASAVAKRGGTLQAGLSGGSASDSLDALNPDNNIDDARVFALFDPLVALDDNAVPQLFLAEEITPNANATVWTIRVRPDVAFHNGKEFTAADVAYTFRRIVNPQNPAAGAGPLAPLDVAGMTQLDKFTLRVPCKTPFSTFVETLANPYYLMVPTGFDPTHPVGTGPFRYKSFTPGVQSVFTRNNNYWQHGYPYLDTLVITDFADETSQVNALLSGSQDVIDLLSIGSADALRSGGAELIIEDGGGWNPITMRVDQPPFTDVRVRQAFRLIPDRQEMLRLVFGGYGRIGNDVFSVWDPCYDRQLPQRQQDLEQAKFLLKKAGQEDLSIELVTGDIAQGVVETAEVFAQQAKGAGVNVSIRQLSVTDFYGPNYLKWVFAQDFWGYYAYLPQVAFDLLPTAPYNETHWDDPRYNQLYATALATPEKARQYDICHEMQLIDYNDGGLIIPYFVPAIDAHSKNVHGIQRSKVGRPLGNYNFRTVWVD
jgi:peptide/nickel transport system substrate-binding protein